MVYATSNNHLEMVKFFVERGANEFDGVLKIAQDRGYKKLVEFFEEKIEESTI